MVISTFLLFPIIIFYFSPYLIILGALEGIASGSVVMFSLQFLFSLFFGRSLCGYICPLGGLQECLMLVNNKQVKNGKINLLKFCFWIPWLISIIIIFSYGGGIKKFDFFFHTKYGVSLYEPITYMIYYGVVILVVTLSVKIGKRAFCHYVCWMSPFMILGTKLSRKLKLPLLHLKIDKTKCLKCGLCSTKCPMSLNVQKLIEDEKMTNSECILCGECINTCKKDVIKYSWKMKI